MIARPRRYQLRKEAVGVIHRHPWLFREQLSSAAEVFRDGEWLRLFDGGNRVVGHGVYEADGAIAIRVIRTGAAPVDAAYIRQRLAAAVAARGKLAATTDGIRLVHGESDHLPAVVVDRFGDTLVATSYSAGTDAIARYAAHALAHPDRLATGSHTAAALAAIIGPATRIMMRPAHRRHSPSAPPQIVRGTAAAIAHFHEAGLELAVDLEAGHKTGAYLDLRALRRTIVLAAPPVGGAARPAQVGASAAAPLTGARVLNLFSYTGMLGRAAEAAGAAEITHVDASERALAFAAAHHVRDPSRHHFICADVFDWLPELDPADRFDVVIVDPPSMTSRKAQVEQVLRAYRRLYRAAATHVRPGGTLIAACCTSRVTRDAFARVVRESLGERFGHTRDLPPEPDHPVGFPEADYLKVAWWTRLT